MKVLVAMSGGVDSSVAAQLLTGQGHTCIGCTMKLYGNEDAGLSKGHTCCSLDDVEDARSVAYRLGMPYYVFNFADDFRDKVIRRFAESYEAGRTPNPCVFCNREIKFGAMWDAAQALGAAEPAALIERNRAIAEAFTVGKDTAPHIRRYYDDLTEQTAKELVV